MGKHPSISTILWGKCYGGLFTRRRKNKPETIEERPPPPPVDIITNNNTLKRHPAKSCAHPPISKRRPIPDLPPDIITNILARLPAKCIFQLWQQTDSSDLLYQLTTNPHFLRTNLDRGRATQTIVVQSLTKSVGNVIKLFVSPDGRADNLEPIIPRTLDLSSCNAYCRNSVTLCGSLDGFLLFRCLSGPKLFCVWNPITKEQAIVTPHPDYITSVCGFYFHPLKREYEVLCARISAMAMSWEFQIISLRTKRRRSVGRCSYGPSRIKTEPVFINGTLYWMVHHFMYSRGGGVAATPSLTDSILSFNIETEEFSTMEVAEPLNTIPPWRIEYVFQLFELEGHLCLFDSSSETDGAFIWELNYDTKRWVKKHSMWNLPGKYWIYCVQIEYIKMTGELIVYVTNFSRYKTPYVYNLRGHGSGKPFEMNGFADDSFTITTHTHSLVSLGAADSVIPIEW